VLEENVETVRCLFRAVEERRFVGALETYDSKSIILLLGELAYLGSTFARTKVCGAELLARGCVLLLC
jgi:hypothetical protein